MALSLPHSPFSATAPGVGPRLKAWPVLLLGLTLIVTACKKNAVDPAQLQEVAQFYVDNDGLPLADDATHKYTRPCLKSLDMERTLLGGPLAPEEEVDFVERHKLASTVRTQRPSGYIGVKLTPLPPYEKNWLGKEGSQSFCFGKFELLKVEAVPDAQPITAGANEPYIVPGTKAHATRLTFKLIDVPGGDFVKDLKAHRTVLTRDSMGPEDYGKEFTVTAVLPEKVENFNVTR